MKIYKCDICGKCCEDCYELNSDTFDVFKVDFVDRGCYNNERKMKINDLCPECFEDIKKYIHDKVFQRLNKEAKDESIRG